MRKLKSDKIRLNREEKRLAIIRASVFAFAEKGFHGTSVKNIAKAAGISEGLLYKYFSSKEDIYLSLRETYLDNKLMSILDQFKDKDLGGKTLIEIVYCWVTLITTDTSKKMKEQNAFERLLIYSFVENPEYLEHLFLMFERELAPIWNKCIQTARKNNELKKNTNIKNSMLFAHNTAMITNFINIAGLKIFSSDGKYEDVVRDIIQFVLMGIGLKDEVIVRYYKPNKLRKYLSIKY